MESFQADVEEQTEEIPGRKKSRLKSLKSRLFGRSKRAATQPLSQSASDITAGNQLSSEQDPTCSQSMMGLRALSHDSIFLADQDVVDSAPTRILSQENVHSRIRALQMKLQQQNLHLAPPPLVKPITVPDDKEQAPPLSNPMMSAGAPGNVIHGPAPSEPRSRTLAAVFKPVKAPPPPPDPAPSSWCAEPPPDFSSPPCLAPRLDSSAARHRMSVKPKNQRLRTRRRPGPPGPVPGPPSDGLNHSWITASARGIAEEDGTQEVAPGFPALTPTLEEDAPPITAADDGQSEGGSADTEDRSESQTSLDIAEGADGARLLRQVAGGRAEEEGLRNQATPPPWVGGVATEAGHQGEDRPAFAVTLRSTSQLQRSHEDATAIKQPMTAPLTGASCGGITASDLHGSAHSDKKGSPPIGVTLSPPTGVQSAPCQATPTAAPTATPTAATAEMSWMSLAMEKTRSLQQLFTSKFPRDLTGMQTVATPTIAPTVATPTITPTVATPTITPTVATPTITPTISPTIPTTRATFRPNITPTVASPAITPTMANSTITPSVATPTITPTISPTIGYPTTRTTLRPTITPTTTPTVATPTIFPTMATSTIRHTITASVATPTFTPTVATPTIRPAITPTVATPTITPTIFPTMATSTIRHTITASVATPTFTPTVATPTIRPAITPTVATPTIRPHIYPTVARPTIFPSVATPTISPYVATPAIPPTMTPTVATPTITPTAVPSLTTTRPRSATTPPAGAPSHTQPRLANPAEALRTSSMRLQEAPPSAGPVPQLSLKQAQPPPPACSQRSPHAAPQLRPLVSAPHPSATPLSASPPAALCASPVRGGGSDALQDTGKPAFAAGQVGVGGRWAGPVSQKVASLERKVERSSSPGTRIVDIRRSPGHTEPPSPVRTDSRAESSPVAGPGAGAGPEPALNESSPTKWLRKNLRSSSPAPAPAPSDGEEPSWMALAKRKSMAWSDKSMD